MEAAPASETSEASDNARWYTAQDALAKLQSIGIDVSEMVVYRLIAARRFPGIKFGRRIYLRPDTFDAFLAEAATTDTLLDIATWQPKDSAAPTPDFPHGSGPRAGEGVA